MEHGFIPAVLAEEGHILAEIHILEMIRYKAPVASLHPFPEIRQCIFISSWFHTKA